MQRRGSSDENRVERGRVARVVAQNGEKIFQLSLQTLGLVDVPYDCPRCRAFVGSRSGRTGCCDCRELHVSLPSGSQIERAIHCSGAAVLPRVHSTSEPAERGTALHHYLATVGTVGREAALAQVPDQWRAAAELIDLAHLPQVDPAGWAHEIALAYDVDTGQARELHRGAEHGRDYRGVGPREIPMTLDALGLSDDAVVYPDWKTGYKRVTRARDNWQLRVGGLAAARAFGRHRALVEIVYLREHADPWHDRAELGALDLDETALALRTAADRWESARTAYEAGRYPDLEVGDWCRYCACRLSCTAQTALAQRLRMEPQAVVGAVDLIGVDDVAAGWGVYRQAQAMVDEMTAYLTEMRNRLIGAVRAIGPVPTRDGYVLAERETRRESVNGDVAYHVINTLHGSAVADAAVTMDTSKAGIRRALAPRAEELGMPLSQLEREVLEQVRALGGVSLKLSSRVDEWPTKEGR